jgi:glucosyl-dolichyl phosphate glucuronosyltransferase
MAGSGGVLSAGSGRRIDKSAGSRSRQQLAPLRVVILGSPRVGFGRSMPAPLAITAVVCTLDRGPAIERTVATMLDQRLPAERFEVLLIDNGSRPENRAVLERLAAAHPGRVRYVREDVRGLSHARNRGIAEVRSDLLVFADDDALVTPTWLSTYVDAFAADPDTAVLGSSVELVHEGAPPAWLEDWLLPYLGAFDKGSAPCPLSPMECPRGGNMAFRRAVFDRIGGFHAEFGRKPGSLVSLEEVELGSRAVAAGFRLGYVPGAPLLHLVEPFRYERRWFTARLYWQGRSMALLDGAHGGRWRLLCRLPGQLRRMLLRWGLRRQVPWGYVRGALRLLVGIERLPRLPRP